jgi:hypothetical protein
VSADALTGNISYISATDRTKIKLRQYKLTNMGYDGHFLTILAL